MTQNGTDIIRGRLASIVPEKKGLLDEMEDLEKKRKARKEKKEGEKESKSGLDLDRIW